MNSHPNGEAQDVSRAWGRVLVLPAAHSVPVDRSLTLHFPIPKMEDGLLALPASCLEHGPATLAAVHLLSTTFLSTPSPSVGAHGQHNISEV